MFDFIKKIAGGSDTSKSDQNPVQKSQKSMPDSINLPNQSLVNNGLSKQLFSDLNRNNQKSIEKSPEKEKRFKIFEKEKEDMNQSFANFMNVGKQKEEKKDEREKPKLIEDKKEKKKIFEPTTNEYHREDLLAEKSLNILQTNQNAIMNQDDPFETKEIDTHYQNETSEEKLIEKELLKLPYNPRIDDVAKRVEILDRYNKIIAGRLSKNALKHYEKFAEGLNIIDLINIKVDNTINNIKFVRGYIGNLKKTYYVKGKNIMAILRKKQQLEKLLEFLNKFQKKFGSIYKKLNQIEENGSNINFHELIPIINKAKNEFNEEKTLITKFVCLQNMDNFLTKKLEEIKIYVKYSMQTIYRNFDEKRYFSLLKSYYHLEKKYGYYNPLTKEYLNFINKNVKEIIKLTFEKVALEYKLNLNLQYETNFKPTKMMFQISKEHYIPLLQRLFHELSNFMYNSHLCCRFHENNENKLRDIDEKDFSDYFCSLKLEYLANRKIIWLKIQSKVSKILLSTDHILGFTSSEIGNFLNYCNKFLEIGEDFSNLSSKELKDIIMKKIKLYFDHFQENYLMNLKTILLNEEWKRLPLPKSYKHNPLIDLLKNFPSDTIRKISCLMSEQSNIKKIENLSIKDYSNQNNALSSFVIGNPFDLKQEKNGKNIMKSNYRLNENKNLNNQSFINIENINFSSDVVVCSSASNVVKGFETYLQMMDFLRPISFDVYIGLTQIIDYYIYAILHFFCNESTRKNLINEINLNNIKTNLKEDESNIALLENQHDIYIFQSQFQNLKNYLIRIYDMIDNISSKFNAKKSDCTLQFSNYNSGIYSEFTERVIACEALQFILDYFNLMKSLILRLNQDPKHNSYIIDSYNNYNVVYTELKCFVYTSFIPSLFKNDNIFSNIPNLKWDTKEINSELGNIYIERIIFFIKDQKEKLSCLGGGSIPNNSQKEILSLFVGACMKQLIEAYAKIKKVLFFIILFIFLKCNSNGRQQMLNEFFSICKSLESLNEGYIPFKDLVEQYIVVWNKKIEDVVDFIINSKHYNLKYLMGLFNTNNSYSMLKKQNKREFLLRIEKEYIDFLKLKSL